MVRRGLKLAVVAACTAAASASQDWNEVLKAFEKFQQDFEKTYEEAEKEFRFGAFAKNYAIVQEENGKLGKSYKLEMNEYADMTSEEFAKVKLGYKPHSGVWGSLANLGVHRPSGVAVPDSVDWTQKGGVTAVKNQGQCGSCWAFSSTGSLEGAWLVATGQLVSLSEQQLVDCDKAQDQGCSGGLMDNAFKYEEGVAVCTEASYPYTAKDGTCQASTCTAGIPKGGVVGFKDVTPSNEQAMMEAVAQQPVSVAIEADKSIFQLYKSGVLDGACGTQLDHGVLVVGYGVDSGKKYWLVKNSWGAGWGLNGYVKIARGTGGVGTCGILSQPSYPVVQGSGPAPPPSPSPTPTPTPTPPPSPTPPSSTHYEKPPCRSDEVDASIQGMDGEVCAPECDASGACPTDKPAGTKATPQCVLSDSASGKKYCALACGFDSGCPSGAKCARQGLSGICVYPQTETAPAKTLVWTRGEDEVVV